MKTRIYELTQKKPVIESDVKEGVYMSKCKAVKVLVAASVTAAATTLFLCAPGKVTEEQKKQMMGRNYAHRGLHTKNKTVPENSIQAFGLAASEGYGIELDVRLTKDGKVVVFHDDTLERVCGVDKRVDELTFHELTKMRLCETDQEIPLFTEVLELVNGRGPLVVEVKPGKNRKELCEKTQAILSGYKGAYCIESFDPFVVAWFRTHASDTIRGQLSMPYEYYKDLKPAMKFMLSRCLFNCIARPHFIAYKIGKRPLAVHVSEMLGALKVGWTSHEAKNEKRRDAVIFEFYHPNIKFK